MAHYLRLTTDDQDGDHEVNAEQVLGDESPLVFDESGYASVEDEDDADALARRYNLIERADPPEDRSEGAKTPQERREERQAERQTETDEGGDVHGSEGPVGAAEETGNTETAAEDSETQDESAEDTDTEPADAPFDPGEYTIAELDGELDDRDLSDEELDALAEAERNGDDREGALDTIDDHRGG